MSVVGKFSSEEDSVKFDTLAWKMRLPSAAILRDDTQPDGITVHSNVSNRHSIHTSDYELGMGPGSVVSSLDSLGKRQATVK